MCIFVHHLEMLHYKNCCPAQEGCRAQCRRSLERSCRGIDTFWYCWGECFGNNIYWRKLGLEEDAVVFEMKTKGQETMWILHCQLNHAQANQSPMISCWNPPWILTSFSEPFSVQEHNIVVRLGPKGSPLTGQHVASNLMWSLTMLTVEC